MYQQLLRPACMLFIAAFLLPACASIVSKTSYPVHIRTEPLGANITITDKKGKEVFKGKSPTEVTLKSGAGYFSKALYHVKISRPGYEDRTVDVMFKLNGWYFGNLVFGGLVGMLIIDPATGAMWKVVDPIIDETLDKSVVSAGKEPSLKIVDINNLPDEERKKLVRIN